MIIEAKNTYGDGPYDVVIDPFAVLINLACDWRVSIGVDRNSPIMGGYWMRKESHDETGPYTRIRLATREEIVQYDAFKLISQYTAIL